MRTNRGKALMDKSKVFLRASFVPRTNGSQQGSKSGTSNAHLAQAGFDHGRPIHCPGGGRRGRHCPSLYARGPATRDEVGNLNATLEERVAARTADVPRANDEIQRFAYIVTHDLRAPLVNIMGFTSELEGRSRPCKP